MKWLGVAIAASMTVIASLIVGWWGVVLVAIVMSGAPTRLKLPAAMMALAAALGWGALIARHAMRGDLAGWLGRSGALFGVPGPALVALALLFAALLAWSAAVLVQGLTTHD